VTAAMTLNSKYELFDLLHEGDTKTYLARQMSSGRQVLVHLRPLAGAPPRPGHSDTFGTLWKYLKTTLREGRSKVLDMGEYESGIYFVTEFAPGFQSLDQWLDSQMAAFEDATVVVRTPEAAPVDVASQEATQTIILKTALPAPEKEPAGGMVPPAPMAGTGQVVLQAQPEKQVMPEASRENLEATQISPALTEALTQARDAWLAQKRSEAPAAPRPAESSGEFTLIFQPAERQVAPSARPPETPTPPPSSAPDPSASLLSPATSQPSSPPPGIKSSVPASSGSGEFTRIFQTPGLGSQEKSMPDFAKPEPSFPAQTTPGEFTRIFQAPAPRQEPAFTNPSGEAPSAPGEFTQVFGSAMQSFMGSAGSPQNQLPGASAPGAMKSPQAPQPGASPVLPSQEAKMRHSFLPWVIVVCVSIAALGAFLYFFLKH